MVKKHFLLSAIVALFCLWLLYLAGSNFLLRSEGFKQKISSRDFLVSYESAWTWFPGRLNFYHLHLEDPSAWKLDVDTGALHIAIWPLFKKEFELVRAEVDGVEFEYTEQPAPPPRSKSSDWTFQLQQIIFEHIRTVRWEKLEFKNLTRIEAGIDLIAILAEPRGPLTGHFKMLEPEVDLQVLNPFLKSLADLKFEKGKGKVDLDLEVAKDQWSPKSSLSASITEGELALFETHRATGNGNLRWTIKDDQSAHQLELKLNDYAFAAKADSPPLFKGKDFQIEAESQGLDVFKMHRDFKGKVIIPKAKIEDARPFNVYIPPSLQFKLLSGSGSVEGELPFSSDENAKPGFFEIKIAKLQSQFEDLFMKIDDLHLSWNPKLTSLGSSQFHLQDLKIALKGSEISQGKKLIQKDWFANLAADRTELEVGKTFKVQTQFKIQMKNSLPPLAIAKRGAELPGWAEDFLQLENVNATGKLKVAGEDLDLTDFQFKSAQGGLIGGFQARPQRLKFLFLVDYGMLSLALSRVGENTDFKLIRAKSWYEARRWWGTSKSHK